MFPTAEPMASLSLGRICGSRAERAAENGGPSSTVANSSAQVPPSGTWGRAMISTRPPRTRSSVIMTCRRGSASKMPDRARPPTMGGR